MRGVVPKMRLSCALSQRTKARNVIANILRAVKAGNCHRAERIIDSREYHYATGCVSYATMARVYHKVQQCRKDG